MFDGMLNKRRKKSEKKRKQTNETTQKNIRINQNRSFLALRIIITTSYAIWIYVYGHGGEV